MKKLKTYIYDSTFDGLLCAISKGFKEGSNFSIKTDDYQLIIDNLSINIITDKLLSEKTYSRIINRWGNGVMENIYKAFLYPETENLIVLYLSTLIKENPNADILAHPSLIELQKRVLKISKEVHRWHGFLRFKELENEVFYSSYEPDFDLTPLISPHFSSRFKNQRIIIHDIKRGYGAFCQNQEIFYSKIDDNYIFSLSKEEQFYQDGWRAYFESLGIESRKNPKLQMSMMPKKYWKFLIEKEGDF